MKKTVVLLSVILLLFLTACGTSQNNGSGNNAGNAGNNADTPPAPPADAEEQVTIQWGIYQDPARLEVSERQAEAFNNTHPNIEVEVVAVPFAQYYEKLGSQLATGTAYDVMMISGSYFSQVAPAGGFMDLTGFIERDGLDLSQYTTEKANSEWEDKIYSLPFELDIQSLFYNKDLFDAANVAYPTEEWTWDDFLDAAKKLTRTVDGEQTWGYYADNLYPTWVTWIGQSGGSVFAEDGVTPALDSPEVKKALQFIDDMLHKHNVSPLPGELPEGVNAFHSGLVAMAIDGSYSVRPTQNTVDFAWDVAPLPQGKERAAAYWTQGIAIANATKHPDAAWEFAKYLMSEEGQAILAETKMATPSLKPVAESDQYLTGGPQGMKVFIDAYEYGEPIPFNDKWFDLMRGPNSAMGEPFAKLWMNEISADEAAQQANANVAKVMGQ